MKTTLRLVCAVALVTLIVAGVSGQTVYRSVASGNWSTAATWEKSTDGGTTWAAATAAPAAVDSLADVIIQTGTTVVVEASPKYCNNLTVQSGAMIYANVLQPTSTIRYIRMKGTSFHVDGTFGFPADPADSSDVLSVEGQGDQTLTFTGSGSICISRIRPRGGRSNVNFVFDTDVTLTYMGSSGTGGSSLYTNEAGSTNITVTVNSGRTVTAIMNSNVATTSSTATDGPGTSTFTVNGTLDLQGGILSLRTAASGSTALNVGAGGIVRVGKDLLPTGTTGVTSAITVDGSMEVGLLAGRMSDFTNAAQFVSGSGSYSVVPGSRILIGAPDGLNATTGPIRTTTIDLSADAIYEYRGLAAQVTGALLPATVKGLVIADTNGVSLSQSVYVDSVFTMTAGILSQGAFTLTLGPGVTASRSGGYVLESLVREGITGSALFPIGTATGYAPVTLAVTSGTGNYTVTAVDGAHPNVADNTKALQRYWTIAGSGVTAADLTFGYPAADVQGTEASYVGARYRGAGNEWKQYPTTIDAVNHAATVSGVSTFSDWTLGEPSALPDPYDDPSSLTVKNAGAITLDGKLDEADWTGAPTLLYGMGAQLKKGAGEYTVTAGLDVKNPFWDGGVQYYVPHTDSTLAKVKFLRKGMNLYIGFTSDDKSICKFDWEGEGMFLKIKNSVGQDREYKLYWQNIEANKDTMRYEEQVVGSGGGKGFLFTGSTVNDTLDVDAGYSAEMMLDLSKLGYTAPLSSVELTLVMFDPDGFQHPMNSWDHTIGSFYKSWWGSEWGGTYRTLEFTPEPFDDPDSLIAKVATGVLTLDGKLDEADWGDAPTLVYGMGAYLKKGAGEYTVTAGLDVKNPFWDGGVQYYVPHTDSTLTKVKFIQSGMNLYIGFTSDDKSICKFDWEGEGMFLKIKNSVGQDREYKLYWQNIEANKDTMRYEEQVVGSGGGKGFLFTGSTVNDTLDVDAGYSAEMMLDLSKLGYTSPTMTVQLTLVMFDPDGFQHPMNSWDHTIGSFYKSWWGSEWGGVYRKLVLTATSDVEGASDVLPAVFALGQNYPNPFNPSTTIRYQVPQHSMVTLKVYDLVGREITTLVDGDIAPGFYSAQFDARALSSGTYFYRLVATPLGGGTPFVSTMKFVVLK